MPRADCQHRRFGSTLPSCVLIAATTLIQIAPADASNEVTVTPIKHIIIIIGENRSFDHVFATYRPVKKEDRILNLLSKGIVQGDGTPGPNYGDALQYQAFVRKTYELTPPKRPYAVLPSALVGGPSTPDVCQALGVTSGTSCVTQTNISEVMAIENGLPTEYYQYLLTGGTGQKSGSPDRRIYYNSRDASHLPPGPYQITGPSYPYDSYAASPVHRFFQMWQQLDCDAAATSEANGWGCKSDLFPWVEVTVGAGSNGGAQPAGFNDESTGEGSTSMGFFNVQQGDAPYLKELADTYAMSDNYHQAINGGTGANHIMLGTGDAIWFSNQDGNPAVPPHNLVNPQSPGTPVIADLGALSELEDPNPQSDTNNYYIQDGYGGGSGSPTAVAPNASYGSGS